MSKGEEICKLISELPKLNVVPGLKGLLNTSVSAKLKEITLRRYEEEQVNKLVRRLRSESPG
jgi:hypothetical protein